MENPSPTKLRHKVKRSWLLLKSSWRVFKLDKELTAFPVISTLITLLLIAVAAYTLLATKAITFTANANEAGVFNHLGWGTIPLLAVSYIVLRFIGNFFGAALIHGALERFKGNDPTVKGSLRAATHRWRPILFFSVMMGLVGLVIDYLQEYATRLPVVGGFIASLLVNLVGFAWEVANFFSLAHIMNDEKELKPLQATKKSVATIKRVWGEGVIANAGLEIITMLILVVFALLSTGAGIFTFSIHALVATWSIGGFAVLGLLVMVMVSSVLSTILKAAIFYYAETGRAPEDFDKELLRASMTPKKARRIFGGTKTDKTWA